MRRDPIIAAASTHKPNVNPEDEACRIVLVRNGFSAPLQVAAPMKHKTICFEILKEAYKVVERSAAHCFLPILVQRAELTIVMRMSGRVDVAAPMPNQELSLALIKQARIIIERYGNEELDPIGSINVKGKALSA